MYSPHDPHESPSTPSFVRVLHRSRLFNFVLISIIGYMVASYVFAATPNPGHPWSQVGDGTAAFVSSSSVLRSYTLPDGDTSIVTAFPMMQGGLFYGSASSTVGVLSPTTTAGYVLTNSGAAGGPAWGLFDLTNATGVLAVAEGGTGTATLPYGVVTASTTGSYQSIPATPVGGYLAVNASNQWVVASSAAQQVLTPPDTAATTVNVTTLANGTTYFLYLGEAQKSFTSCSVRARVTTAYGGAVTYNEIGIFKGAVVPGAGTSLTRLGTASVTGVYNATGAFSTSITAAINPGDQLWFAVGQQNTVVFALRGGVRNELQSGQMLQAVGRPSTIGSPVAAAASLQTYIPPWVSVTCQ